MIKTILMRFHVVFKENEIDYFSKGETFFGLTVIEVYKQFIEKYPNVIFLAMYRLDIPLFSNQEMKEI